MDTKENILNESLSLFAEKGYAAVGVQEIVNNSSITKPTLYHHFGNKEGLFEALLDREFSPFIKGLSLLINGDQDIFQKLEKLLSYFLESSQNRCDFFRLYLNISFSPPRSEENRMGGVKIHQIERLFEDMFIGASYVHGNMRGRHRHYAISFLGLLNSTVNKSLREEIEISGDFVFKTIHQFAHGIYS